MIKKIIVLIFIFTAYIFITSCSNKTGAESPDAAVSAQADITEDENTVKEEFDDRQNVNDGIGAYDFNNAEFKIVLSTKQMQEPYFADEEIGSIINDAVYRRNLEIEERFNVDLILKDTGGDWDEVASAIKKSVMAASSDYDFGLAHTFIGLTGLISSGYLYDWNKIPEVDMAKSWWNSNIKETLSIDGRLFVASSDYVYQRPGVIYFNKNTVTDFSLENPYTLVKNGDWTWDKLAGMSAVVSTDLNGDGIYDEHDKYGYAHWVNWQTVTVIHSNGMYLTEIDGEGYPRYTPYLTEKMATIFEKYYDLLYTGNKTFLIKAPSSGTVGSQTPLFDNGQILFLHGNTELLKSFLALTIDFGMIPLPKYDKTQKDYHSMADTQMMVIPADAKDMKMTGVITDALSFYSYKYVVPAVYDVMYANRYLRDEESYEMFNLIMKGLVYEFSWTFGEGNVMTYALPNLMNEKNTNITSFYGKNAPSVENTMAKFIDNVMELK